MARQGKIRRRLRRKAPPVRRQPDPATKGMRDKAAEGNGLLVGGAKDPAETAADNMAAQVMASGATAAPSPSGGQALRRQVSTPAVAPGAAAAKAPAGAARDVAAVGAGQPMSPIERGWFEPRFGADLSDVRVHEGAAANRAATAIGARAFAQGRDVAFATGERRRDVMAHELAHVVQDGGAGALRRDLAIPAPNAGAAPAVLTPEERAAAMDSNRRRFEDPFTIVIIRDVIGISKYPGIPDEDFLDGLLRWQADHGLTQDGKFGPETTQTFLDELMAEGRNDLATLLRGDNFVQVTTINPQTRNLPPAAPTHADFVSATWNVAFRTSLRNGFIVQRVQSARTDTPALPAAFTPAAPNYWEAWSVDGHGTVSPLGPGGAHDFWTRVAFVNSSGTWSQRGTLYTVLNLPAQFSAPGGANAAAAAGTLRSALNLSAANIEGLGLPEGFVAIELGNERDRVFRGRFNFTGPPATHTHTET